MAHCLRHAVCGQSGGDIPRAPAGPGATKRENSLHPASRRNFAAKPTRPHPGRNWLLSTRGNLLLSQQAPWGELAVQHQALPQESGA
eukprot:jgi/Botrbrau1/23145/Bobra.0692s0001.2